jgi:hypothetical protein
MNALTILARKMRFGLCLALIASMGLATLSPAARKPGHDRLEEALTLLNQAKDSSSPVQLLFQAKDEVQGTLVPHKDPERDKALSAIDDAIHAAGTNEGAKRAIDKAITAVRALAGMGNGGKKKK